MRLFALTCHLPCCPGSLVQLQDVVLRTMTISILIAGDTPTSRKIPFALKFLRRCCHLAALLGAKLRL